MIEKETRDGPLYVSGYIDDQVTKYPESRHFGYPDNGFPDLKFDSLEVESSILVALLHTSH